MDKEGNTIDFLLTAKRDKQAAFRFFTRSFGLNCKPSLINIDKSGGNKERGFNFEVQRLTKS